ncbi:MAG: DivIVA domain-containing protein, partial [Clostridia bacterium]|nr:DivIVA domain-containing protein [Clostridia bacterium]
MVTPQDIAEKGFRISFRGYNTEEVDDFLQEIYDSYIEIYEANQKLNETTGRLSDAVGQYKSMEDTLNDALNIAGMSADEIEESAHSKAAEILKNAELAANSIIAGAEQKIAAEQYRLENIKRETETYKAKIIELLNAQLCVLNEYPESASLSGVDSASDKDAHMWKKHRNSAKGKTFTKASADSKDAKQ